MSLWERGVDGEREAYWQSERIANLVEVAIGEKSEGTGVDERRRTVAGERSLTGLGGLNG